MTRRLFVLSPLPLILRASEYRVALPGYRFEFPRDHFDHPDFRTEWWYFTGNLWTPGRRRFGFELTFFRHGMEKGQPRNPLPPSAWTMDHAYLAHFAVSDLEAGRFMKEERLNRGGPGLAGASFEQRRIWNGNWQAQWKGTGKELRALTEDFAIRLHLEPEKLPVIHGRDGLSQRAAGPGRASHYVSFTRLAASGEIGIGSQTWSVDGTAWMDHEFFTHKLTGDQTGWDWFSIQLNDGSELMIYRLRLKDGAVEPYSSGTYVDRNGRSRHLTLADYEVSPGKHWTSPATGANYPIEWLIRVPALDLILQVTTPLPEQELVAARGNGTNYWEGAVDYQGRKKGQAISGVGYLEMTGYDRPVDLGRQGAP